MVVELRSSTKTQLCVCVLFWRHESRPASSLQCSPRRGRDATQIVAVRRGPHKNVVLTPDGHAPKNSAGSFPSHIAAEDVLPGLETLGDAKPGLAQR